MKARLLPFSALLLAGVTALAGCGRPAADQRFAEALRALRAGDLEPAQTSAREAATLDPARFGAYDAFVRGNVAFARSVAAEAEGRRPGGDPEALKFAARLAEDALAAWQWAAASRPDWPAARRNVERGLLRVERLREKRSTPGPRPDGRPEPRPGEEPPDGPPRPEPPRPPRPADGTDEERPPVERPRLESAELPAGRVLEVFDRLRAREREKLEIRRAQRSLRSAAVERDW